VIGWPSADILRFINIFINIYNNRHIEKRKEKKRSQEYSLQSHLHEEKSLIKILNLVVYNNKYLEVYQPGSA